MAIAGAVYAAEYDLSVHTVKSQALKNKAGSKKHPAPFLANWRYDLTQPQGVRGPAPITWSWKWDGVKMDGSHHPVCTADMIDEGQTDTVCPKGSLVATTTFAAKLGPEGDPVNNVECVGKSTNVFNGGKNVQVWSIVGPPEGCAGVGYIPPFPVTFKTKKRTTTATLVFPSNVTHPLPGIEGGLTFEDVKPVAKNNTVKKGKKSYSYMSSTSCKGNRMFRFTIVDSEGTHKVNTSAGKCKK
jgi:hypothetical protein